MSGRFVLLSGLCITALTVGIARAAEPAAPRPGAAKPATAPVAAAPASSSKSMAAAAVRKSDRAIREAEERLVHAKAAARAQLVKDLTDARRAAMQADDLAEANEIDRMLNEPRAATDEAVAPSAQTRPAAPAPFAASQQPAPSPQPVGGWRVAYANGITRRYVFDGNTVEWTEANKSRGGTVTPDGHEAFFVDTGDGKIERWSPVGSRYLVEHWTPKSSFPDGPVMLALATRQK